MSRNMENFVKGEQLQMKKILKIVAVVIAVLIILNSICYITARYGWKLFKFDMCENPDVLCIETIFVTDKSVHISGKTSSSATSYIGYTYEIKDNVLYLGIKQNLMFGFHDRIGSYSFVIEDDFENIESVYLLNKNEEKCIWSLSEDKKYMEKIKAVRLYETVILSDEFDYKEQMKSAEFVYVDEELLNRIQHPAFSDDLYFTKSGRYLGVAELDNGEELYLKFDRHFDYYDVIGKFGYYDY